MRVQSRDYNFDDYIIATYELDPIKQLFSVRQLEILTNVGLTCGTSPLLFLKDSTNSIRMLNGGTIYNPDVIYSLVSTGQTLFVDLDVAQIHCMVTSQNPGDFRAVATDPLGKYIRTSSRRRASISI